MVREDVACFSQARFLSYNFVLIFSLKIVGPNFNGMNSNATTVLQPMYLYRQEDGLCLACGVEQFGPGMASL